MRIDVRRRIDEVQPLWDTLVSRDEVGLESPHLRAIERSAVNDVEPYYLLGYEGAQAVAAAYCFLIEIDFGFLEKELAPETIRTLRAWHPRFMKVRVLESGFVAGLGSAVAAREDVLPRFTAAAAREMERIARDTRAEVVLFRDVPYARYSGFSGLLDQGFQPLCGFPIARMPLRWRTLDEYLQALKATSRYRVRHLLSQRAPDLESEVIPSFSEHAPRLLELWRQTHARAKDYSHEQLNERYFVEIDRELADRSRIVTLKRKGEIVAFSLCLLGDAEYCSSHAGFDYSQREGDNLHFGLSMAVLEDALRSGARSINRGITTYDVKFALGFEAEPQVYLVRHVADSRLTPAIARRLQAAMPQPLNTHRPFKGQDVSERPDLAQIAAELTAARSGGNDVFAKIHKAAIYERASDARLAGLYGFFPPFESAQGPLIQRQGRSVVMLGSNAYLGLATHPEVVAAAKAAIDKYGTGCSGSPFLNGTLDIHVELAEALAQFMGKEDALLCSTGYQTNVGVVSALAAENDLLLMDRLDHASLVDGGRLSPATQARFRHNDMASLEKALAEHPEKPKLVVVDSVFSMEGTIANLRSIVRLSKRHGARVMVDEAHAIGVLGPKGRGGAELLGVLEDVDIVMGTFSKSFASVGGFVAGKAEIIDYLRHAARSHMFSASLPPPAVAAVRAALEIIKREPERRVRVLANAEYMARRLQELGYQASFRGTAIVPVHCGQELLAFGLYKKLLDLGVFVNPVASPAVSKGRELLRTSYMSTHDQRMLDRAADVFAKVRTETFPRHAPRPTAVTVRPPALSVRPLVLLPVLDRRAFTRYWAADGVLRVPGFTRLDIGQSVDCGISFAREQMILQSCGRVVSKSLVPRPGRTLGIDVALAPEDVRARELIEQLLRGRSALPPGRHAWRYHAALEVDCLGEPPVEGERIDDVSVDGAAIHSPRLVECGSDLWLRLRAPGCEPIELASEVRWTRRGDAPAFGVRFLFSDRDERERIRDLIRRIKAAMTSDGCAEAPAAPGLEEGRCSPPRDC